MGQINFDEINLFTTPDNTRAVMQLIVSLLCYSVILCAIYLSFQAGQWGLLAASIGLSGFMITRLFIIMHDCCHYSYFTSVKANRIVGMVLANLTYCCYEYWRVRHNIHHSTHGKLDKRGIGDIHFLTVNEYLSASRFSKLLYRLYRNPMILIFLGVCYEMLINMRFHANDIELTKSVKRRLIRHILLTNLTLVLVHGSLIALLGFKLYCMMIFLPFFVGCWLGMILFYLQHNYDGVEFVDSSDWTREKAAIEASSYLKLPGIVTWAIGWINYHHIHHLNVKVPCYHLVACHQHCFHVNESEVDILRLRDLPKCFRLKLYDERCHKLVGWEVLLCVPK